MRFRLPSTRRARSSTSRAERASRKVSATIRIPKAVHSSPEFREHHWINQSHTMTDQPTSESEVSARVAAPAGVAPDKCRMVLKEKVRHAAFSDFRN